MHIFIAGATSSGMSRGLSTYNRITPREQYATEFDTPHILESFHYIGNPKLVDSLRANGKTLFLDSGAFSAHSLGAVIDITEYCDYVKRNYDLWRVEDGVSMFSVLDGIGDPQKTLENQWEMERQGVRPLPCFHFGEDEKYLEYYINNYPYITIGGCVGRHPNDLIIWLDRIWSRYLTDENGKAKVKVHGFGLTSVEIMERYPWFSVDSSSWVQTAAYGSISLMGYGTLAISTQSPNRHNAGQHIENISEIERQTVLKWIADDHWDFARLSTKMESRAAYNMRYYRLLNLQINAKKEKKPTKVIIQELF